MNWLRKSRSPRKTANPILRLARYGLLMGFVGFNLAVSAGCGGDDEPTPAATNGDGGSSTVGGGSPDGGGNGGADPWAGVDDFIETRMSTASIPGLAAAVIQNGQLVWSAGYGYANVAEQRVVTTETPFLIASISKSVVGVAVMQLWENAQLTLDDEVNSKLSFVIDNPLVLNETIAIKHVVSHTAGIGDNLAILNPLYSQNEDCPIALGTFLEGYLVASGTYYDTDNYSNFDPGTQKEYSNVGTGLGGFLVEVIANKPFDDYCDENIFTPLGMTNTHWHLADFNIDDVALPYKFESDQLTPHYHLGFPDYPSGQLRASITDVARFLGTVVNGGELNGQRILEEATVQEMLTPPFPNVSTEQAVFWHIEERAGRTVVGHTGSETGATTVMFFSPTTNVGVIVLMNVSWTNDIIVALDEIEDHLYDIGEAL